MGEIEKGKKMSEDALKQCEKFFENELSPYVA